VYCLSISMGAGGGFSGKIGFKGTSHEIQLGQN